MCEHKHYTVQNSMEIFSSTLISKYHVRSKSCLESQGFRIFVTVWTNGWEQGWPNVHGFCDYFYSAVFVKKTVTADKNSELWSVPNNVRIQRSHRLAGPDTSLNNPCCCTHAPWLAPCAGERGRSHKSPILEGCWPMSSFFLKISAAFCTWLFVIICWAHVKKTCTHVGK